MTIRPDTFKERANRCLIGVLIVSFCLLLPVHASDEVQSDQIHRLIKQLKSSNPKLRIGAASALGQMGAEAKVAVPALVAALKDNHSQVRVSAVSALARIGADAKDALPALMETVKNDGDPSARGYAARALADIGAEAKDVVSTLIVALRDNDPNVRKPAAEALSQAAQKGAEAGDAVPALIITLEDSDPGVRLSAAFALGQIRADAKAAVPALIAALKNDRDLSVRSFAAYALGQINAEPEATVRALIESLKYSDIETRLQAVIALGEMGPQAKDAIPASIDTLKNDASPYVRYVAANTLAKISRGLYDVKGTEMLPVLKEAYEILKDHPSRDVRRQAVEVKRTTDYFESLWRVGVREGIWLWVINHPTISGIVGAYLLLLIFWSILFWLRPLWLLPISALLCRYEPKIKTQNMEIGLPLRHLLLVSLFHYRKRVLDPWVGRHLASARENFANRQTVKERTTYVSTPTMVDGQICESVSPAMMQPIFNKPKATLLIAGEGGAGKTSLACRIAVWGMADEPEERLCRSHRMLPVLIEGNLETQPDAKDAFRETVRGQLRELIGMPDELPEELLLQLLRKRRVLVIVDSLSELDDTTRRGVRPAKADFPVAALIVTSRIDDGLGGAVKTTIKPLRLNKDRLSFFMDRYLEQRGRQFETDEELFESCRNLSQIIGKRDITVLIAKMYAELKIASKEQPSDFDLPRNLPDLMQGYAGNINESVKADRKDTRAVLRSAKAVAWECLRTTWRPASAKRDDVLKALRREPETEAMLEYLEARLQLIQTTGAGKDEIRFSLDPLAEYLASLYLIEHYGDSVSRWHEIIHLIKAQPGAPEMIKGFVLAVQDCLKHHGQAHGVPGFAIEAINQLINPDPAAVASAN